MTPEETLMICMLNTIQDKNLMIKVQEYIKENMDWEEVWNILVNLDRAAHISDSNCQNNFVWLYKSFPIFPPAA